MVDEGGERAEEKVEAKVEEQTEETKKKGDDGDANQKVMKKSAEDREDETSEKASVEDLGVNKAPDPEDQEVTG